MRKICGISRTSSSKNRKTINMKTAKDYQQEFRLKDDELAQFDEFLNDPKRTCFHGKEGQFSDSDKKTAENFGCEYMDVDDFVYKYNNR